MLPSHGGVPTASHLSQSHRIRRLFHGVLQRLQGPDLDDLAGGLGLEHLLLLGEGIDPLVGRHGGLLDRHDLQQARQHEDARPFLADVLLGQIAQGVDDRRHLLAGEFRGRGRCC